MLHVYIIQHMHVLSYYKNSKLKATKTKICEILMDFSKANDNQPNDLTIVKIKFDDISTTSSAFLLL